VVNRADLQKTDELYQMSPEDYPQSPPSMGGGGQPMVQQPMFQQPMPINIHLVNGNNNKSEPVLTSGGGNGMPTNGMLSNGNGMPTNGMPTTSNIDPISNMQSAIPDIDSFLSKPMIRGSGQGGSGQGGSGQGGSEQGGGNNALDSLGNGKVSFVVKKI
jgi:hypothetical protein